MLAGCGGEGLDESAAADLGGETLGETGGQGDPAGEAGDAGLDGGETDEGGTEAGDPGPTQCDGYGFSLGKLTPNVMLVLDKSGSTNQVSWDDDGDPNTAEVTRWHTLHEVVETITTEYEDEMNLGVTLFPALEAEADSGTFAGACMVHDTPEVPCGPGNAAAVMAAIPSADDMDFAGASPATAGILTATAHLETFEDVLPRAMILVTDGAANCASPENFVSEYDADLEIAVANAWQDLGIPTYVVGIDISEDGGAVVINPRVALDAVATFGGVPNEGEVGFYDATTPEALNAALEEITNRVACQIELGLEPEQLAGMIIEADGQQFSELAGCGDDDGWVPIDPVNQPNMIELCNGACEVVDAAGFAEAVPLCE